MSDVHPFRFEVVAGRPVSGAAWFATARRVEQLGYDTLLLPDTAYTPSPFPALAAAAAVTERLAVGTWVLATPLRTIGSTVRETAALQLLSGGRFRLGLGVGRPDAEREAAALGAPWGTGRERRRQLLETIAAVRAQVDPVPQITIAAVGPRMLDAAGPADRVALAVPPTAALADVRQAVARVRASGADPEFALQVSAVAGRPVAYLARAGLDTAAVAAAVAMLDGDVDAMAESLTALRAATGVSVFPVAEEHAEAFAPVAAALTGS